MPDPSPSAPATGRRGGHVVPESALAVTRRTSAATPGLVGEPSDAERARTIVTEQRTATLSTVAAGSDGTPFGSLVGYAADERGRPLLCLSDLAEHSRNLADERRASILVTEGGVGDPLARGRVTLLGEVIRLDGGPERDEARQRYRAAHPDAFYVAFDDFRLYRLEVSSVRFVRGFGRMSWVDAAEYAAAAPDPLRPHRARIIAHMNDDHPDALLDFCRVLAGRPDTVAARMVDVDRYGFSVLATRSGSDDGARATSPTQDSSAPEAVRFGFDAPADTPHEVRAAMVELVRRARASAH